MEDADLKPIWFRFCGKDNTLDNKKSLLNYLRTIDDKELFNRLKIDTTASRDDLCNILQEDYNQSLSRNDKCHNETTIATLSDTEFIADIYLLFQRDDLVFCLEEGDVKLAILDGTNPHTTAKLSVQEIVKMKEWLAKKRLHSINYEADEISDYQRARAEFIEFMDNPINNYFQSEKFFDRLSTTQLKKIPRLLENETNYLTFTTEEKEYIKTFLLKEDLLVYLTRLLIGKFENTGDNLQTSKLALKILVDEMKLNTGLIKEEFFEAIQQEDWDSVSDLLDQLTPEETGLTKDDVIDLIIENDGYLSLDLIDKLEEKFGINGESSIVLNGKLYHTSDDGINLDLSYSNIDFIPEGIFDKLVNLEIININNNNISSLPEGIFDKLVKLEYLNISENKLTSLPEGIFDKLVNLEIINISNNNLTSLPEGIFDKRVNLEYLDISNNNLTSLPEEIFDNLVNLEYLNISDNKLTSLPNEIFANIVKLVSLDISENKLSSVPTSISKLKKLYIFVYHE